MTTQDAIETRDPTSIIMWPILQGPDKWELLSSLADPGRTDCERVRPMFRIRFANELVESYPLRIDELRRLDTAGNEWAFFGRVEKAPDFDNYDNDGFNRAVQGVYSTATKTGEVAVM